MTTQLDADNFTSGGRGTPNAISPGSNATNWLKIAGSNPTLSFSGTYGQFTNISASTSWQLGSATAADTGSVIRFQVSNTSDSFGLFLRQQATNTYYYVKTTTTQLQIHKLVAGTDTSLANGTFAISAATLYWMRFRVVGTNLYAKIWLDTDTEPDAWTVTTTDSAITGAGGWGIRVAPNATGDTVQIDSYVVNQVFTLSIENLTKFQNATRISVRTRETFYTQDALKTKSVLNFVLPGSPPPAKAPDNPYGITRGLNIGTPPFSSSQFMPAQIFTWTKALGVGWFRINMSAWQLWYVHSDPTSAWHWEAMDDAVNQALQAGFFVSVVLRFVNPTDTSGTYVANGNYYAAHYNTVHVTSGTEDWYMVNQADAVTYATAIANRYNGTTDVISTPSGGSPINYGKLKIHAIEVGNEEFNQHFSHPANPATVFGVYNDTISYFNAYTPTGVTTATKKQPSRSPHWIVPILQGCYPAIKAAHPSCLVVTGAMWSLQPGNNAAWTAGLYSDPVYGTAKGYFDVIQAHFYSNKTPSNTSTGQTVSIDQMLSDIDAAMKAVNDPSPLWIGEFGWQIDQLTTSSTAVAGAGSATITPANMSGAAVNGTMVVDTGGSMETVTITSVTSTTVTGVFANAHSGTYPVTFQQDCNATTQQSNYLYLMEACRKHPRVAKIFFFTLDNSTTGFATSSLIQYGYNGGSGYIQVPAYSTLATEITTYPTWGTAPVTPVNATTTISFGGVDGVVTFTGIDGLISFYGVG